MWLIVVRIVWPVLAVIGLGLVFLRSADPHAVADRDAADKALPTNADLGGTFQEIEHRVFARSRAGLRVEGSFSGCTSADNPLENAGQAPAEPLAVARTALAFQVVGVEVVAVGSPDSATPLVDTITRTANECLVGAVEAGAKSKAPGVTIAVDPAPAPPVGDRAAAFHGSMGVPGGAAAGVDILVVQQGRAVALFFAIDSTGSLHGDRLTQLVNTVLSRLAPRFGSR